MEYLNFSRLTEKDFDDIIEMVGGERFTDDPSIETKNCDYRYENILIELKIIEEEPIEKQSKQNKLAKLFRSDIKTVILNPLDLDYENKRKYYNELSTPIKTAIKKASQQLKISSDNKEYKISIIVNNGLSMTMPDEFFDIAVRRTKNDTSNIDLLIVCGVYHFSDGFDTIATAMFKDVEIQNKEKPNDFIEKLREAWNVKVNDYMTQQIISTEIERTKPPIKDIYFELNNIRYVKPPIQWGKESDFYGKQGRPRFDTTGMETCPPVGVVMPIFDLESYNFVKGNISEVDNYLLRNNLKDYLTWVEKERKDNDDLLKPIVPIKISKEELIKISPPFSFNGIGIALLPVFQEEVVKIAENSYEFNNTPISNNYILLQVNEIGMDKANDIAFISHNRTRMSGETQEYLIKGERMKFEYALTLASAYCLSLNADAVYYMINEDFKWK
jgi:hypothetical protein